MAKENQLPGQNPGIPPGWGHNPSSYARRIPVLIVAAIGFCVASYLTLYQLGIVQHVWEPFFGNGSVTVLHSFISRILPVPDASLGAAAYFVDVMSEVIGGRDRWRTEPWVVMLFGTVVTLAVIISIMLVIFQAFLFHAWCTLCLASASLSFVLAGLARDEVLACIEYLKREHDEGISLWVALLGK